MSFKWYPCNIEKTDGKFANAPFFNGELLTVGRIRSGDTLVVLIRRAKEYHYLNRARPKQRVMPTPPPRHVANETAGYLFAHCTRRI